MGLSTVAYLRGLFPESSFESRDYCSIHINQLLPNTPEAKLLIAWLEKGEQGHLLACCLPTSPSSNE